MHLFILKSIVFHLFIFLVMVKDLFVVVMWCVCLCDNVRVCVGGGGG